MKVNIISTGQSYKDNKVTDEHGNVIDGIIDVKLHINTTGRTAIITFSEFNCNIKNIEVKTEENWEKKVKKAEGKKIICYDDVADGVFSKRLVAIMKTVIRKGHDKLKSIYLDKDYYDEEYGKCTSCTIFNVEIKSMPDTTNYYLDNIKGTLPEQKENLVLGETEKGDFYLGAY